MIRNVQQSYVKEVFHIKKISKRNILYSYFILIKHAERILFLFTGLLVDVRRVNISMKKKIYFRVLFDSAQNCLSKQKKNIYKSKMLIACNTWKVVVWRKHCLVIGQCYNCITLTLQLINWFDNGMHHQTIMTTYYRLYHHEIKSSLRQ